MYKTDKFSTPTTNLYIPFVVSSSSCDVHGSDIGQPCYDSLGVETSGRIYGVCDRRARKVGLTGYIRQESLVRGEKKPKP